MRINDHFENNLLYKNSYTFPPFSFSQRNKWFPLDIDIDTVIFHTSWKKRKGIASVDFKDCNLTHFPENYGDAALKWILLNLSTWPFYIAVFYRNIFLCRENGTLFWKLGTSYFGIRFQWYCVILRLHCLKASTLKMISYKYSWLYIINNCFKFVWKKFCLFIVILHIKKCSIWVKF